MLAFSTVSMLKTMHIKSAQPDIHCTKIQAHLYILTSLSLLFFEAFLPVNLFYVKGKRISLRKREQTLEGVWSDCGVA